MSEENENVLALTNCKLVLLAFDHSSLNHVRAGVVSIFILELSSGYLRFYNKLDGEIIKNINIFINW